MLLELPLDVLNLVFLDVSSANGASLMLWHLVGDFIAELILFLESLHEPISMETDQVETMEALIHSHQIRTISELLQHNSRLVIAEWLKTNCTASVNCIIVLCQNLSYFFMHFENKTSVISILFLLIRELLQSRIYITIMFNEKLTYSSESLCRTWSICSSSRPLTMEKSNVGGSNGY